MELAPDKVTSNWGLMRNLAHLPKDRYDDEAFVNMQNIPPRPLWKLTLLDW